jgi:hypothetical protein
MVGIEEGCLVGKPVGKSLGWRDGCIVGLLKG